MHLLIFVFALVALCIWYMTYPFLSQGIRNNYLSENIFKNFFIEMQWHLPGGLKKRTAYIKENHFDGVDRNVPKDALAYYGWHYRDVIDNNRYEDVARDTRVLGSPIQFWGLYVLLPVLGAFILVHFWFINFFVIPLLIMWYIRYKLYKKNNT